MVVVIPDHGGIIDFLKETPFEVDQVLSLHLHNAGETIDESLNLLVIVELICDDCGHTQYPCTLLQTNSSSRGQAVPREDAERKGNQEGLWCIVYKLHCLQTHL